MVENNIFTVWFSCIDKSWNGISFIRKWHENLVGIWFPSPRLQVMWSITWLVSVTPGRSTYPKVVCAHSNYVYKTCSMHQYDLVPLPLNFHHSSYFEPTNSKSERQHYLPLCTVGASSTGYGPWCQQWWRLKQCLNGSSKRLVLVVISTLSAHCSQWCS